MKLCALVILINELRYTVNTQEANLPYHYYYRFHKAERAAASLSCRLQPTQRLNQINRLQWEGLRWPNCWNSHLQPGRIHV